MGAELDKEAIAALTTTATLLQNGVNRLLPAAQTRVDQAIKAGLPLHVHYKIADGLAEITVSIGSTFLFSLRVPAEIKTSRDSLH